MLHFAAAQTTREAVPVSSGTFPSDSKRQLISMKNLRAVFVQVVDRKPTKEASVKESLKDRNILCV